MTDDWADLERAFARGGGRAWPSRDRVPVRDDDCFGGRAVVPTVMLGAIDGQAGVCRASGGAIEVRPSDRLGPLSRECCFSRIALARGLPMQVGWSGPGAGCVWWGRGALRGGHSSDKRACPGLVAHSKG